MFQFSKYKDGNLFIKKLLLLTLDKRKQKKIDEVIAALFFLGMKITLSQRQVLQND